MKTFGQLVLALVLGGLNVFLGAQVFLTLWSWFIVTTFSEYGVQPLLWVEAFGIGLLIALIKFSATDITDEQTNRTYSQNITRALTVTFVYLLVLAIGWITFQYMPV